MPLDLEMKQQELGLTPGPEGDSHKDCQARQFDVEGFVFDQIRPIGNLNATWHGEPGPQANNPWEPIRILILPGIPSRYRSANTHCAVIAYVPMGQRVLHRPPGRTDATERIKMLCCGPRRADRGCLIGARTSNPCSHCTMALFAGCVVGTNPAAYRTTFRNLAVLDPGTSLSMQYHADVTAGLYN